MAVAQPIHVTDEEFTAEIEKHQGLALVDFWAIWCGPCQVIAPIVEEIAQEYEGKVKVAKLDVDANQQTAMRFNVRSIPSVLFFRDGKLVETVVGVVPKKYLIDKITKHLG